MPEKTVQEISSDISATLITYMHRATDFTKANRREPSRTIIRAKC